VAAVVIMAVVSLLDLRRLMALWRADRLDGLVALTTFLVTLLVGPQRGILAGVGAAALCYLWRTRLREKDKGRQDIPRSVGSGARRRRF
jgi:sulfate permease, SulP family